jgi:mannose-6-phosphate isomerase-like protein (cupin superfamily)
MIPQSSKTDKINIEQKLSLFNDYWNPRIIVELNGQHVKLARLKGSFVWHKHLHEDEMFLVIRGKLRMEFRDHTVDISEKEIIIVPAGVEHRPAADEEVAIMLFEPAGTLNTGDADGDAAGEMTRTDLQWI